MSRVQAVFFHIQTRPADQDPKPGPGLFTKQIFFLGTWTHPYWAPQVSLCPTRFWHNLRPNQKNWIEDQKRKKEKKENRTDFGYRTEQQTEYINDSTFNIKKKKIEEKLNNNT